MTSSDVPARRRLGAIGMALTFSVAAAAAPVLAQDDDMGSGAVEGEVTLYTSVTQDTVDAVLAALEEQHPDLAVELLRAPTGELDARIATETRTGGIAADVLWMTDPLSMQRYDADGLLAPLEGDVFDVVPPEYRSDSFVGTRLLNLIIVVGSDVDPMPESWADLADSAFADAVVLPDPGFAGSAFAALGFFATDEEFGLEFYEQLKANGAIQVASPVDVLNDVAEGRKAAGITLDKIVRSNAEKGSPIELLWPEPGAIALYSPAAAVASSDDLAAAEAFVEFLVSPEAQAAIASTGWQPVRPDVEWPHSGPVVTPDWAELFGEQEDLLEGYRAIFGD